MRNGDLGPWGWAAEFWGLAFFRGGGPAEPHLREVPTAPLLVQWPQCIAHSQHAKAGQKQGTAAQRYIRYGAPLRGFINYRAPARWGGIRISISISTSPATLGLFTVTLGDRSPVRQQITN